MALVPGTRVGMDPLVESAGEEVRTVVGLLIEDGASSWHERDRVRPTILGDGTRNDEQSICDPSSTQPDRFSTSGTPENDEARHSAV